MMDGVRTVTYAGTEKRDNVECHHLKFTQDDFDWEMWVGRGQDGARARGDDRDLSKSMSETSRAGMRRRARTICSRT